MTIEDIRAAYYVEPFKPFVVCVSDGRKLLVSKRHHITLSPTGESIIVLHGEASITRILISNVTALEPPKAKRPRRKSA
jgi:hypothetical protein